MILQDIRHGYHRPLYLWLLCLIASASIMAYIYSNKVLAIYECLSPEALLLASSPYWTSTKSLTVLNPQEESKLRQIPDYILEYAPYCHLYSGEEYWPGVLSEHLEHTTPCIGYDPVPCRFQQPNLRDLDQLNQFKKLYLTSKDDPENYPDWIGGVDNKPMIQQSERAGRRKTQSTVFPGRSTPHRSSAPAVLIVVDKGEYVDAFWFFFYSFNLGNHVLGQRFGNHVGDWEHTAIRFKNGKPTEVFFSEHEWGAAYYWNDTEKSLSDQKRASSSLQLLNIITNLFRC
jgi:hypothetical protein